MHPTDLEVVNSITYAEQQKITAYAAVRELQE